MTSYTLVHYFKLNDQIPRHRLTIEAQPGSYLLLLLLKTEKSIVIGKLGLTTFMPGYYMYSGSAFGPGGLKARVGRHCKPVKKQRWHIDYLRRFCSLTEIWYSTDPINQECNWSDKLACLADSCRPVKTFGSSDCDCYSHLFYFKSKPLVSDLMSLVQE